MEDLKNVLLEKKAELELRLANIDKHSGVELDKDSSERAVQLENDEVLEGLGAEGQEELELVNKALERMAAGTYGTCISCQAKIPMPRLRAMPYTQLCIDCAESK